MSKGKFAQEIVRDRKIVSVTLIGLIVILFLVGWGLQRDFSSLLAFNTLTSASKPWQILTYVLVPSYDLIGVLFASFWMWSIGTVVERDQGSPRFAAVLGIFTVLAALCLWLGSAITGIPGVLVGAWGILSCVTVIWGTRYPNTTTLFMFVIPVKAKWLALLSVALVFFGSHPALAVFAALPLILAALFALDRLPIKYGSGPSAARRVNKTRSGMPTSPEFIADVRKREQERADRERLRKMFEDGMIDNEKEK